MMMGKFKQVFIGVWCAVYFATTTVCASNAVTISEEDLIISTIENTEGQTVLPDKSQIQQVQKEVIGSIEVILTEGKAGTINSGIKVFCQKIANLEKGEYILLEEYKGSGVDFAKIQTSDELKSAAEIIEKAGKNTVGKIEKTTDQNGTALFTDLEVGVYLISIEESETYDIVTPSIVAIPTWNETNGEMEYKVTVSPKHAERAEAAKNTAPQTGLQEDTLLYLILAAICLSAACGLVVVKKRKR